VKLRTFRLERHESPRSQLRRPSGSGPSEGDLRGARLSATQRLARTLLVDVALGTIDPEKTDANAPLPRAQLDVDRVAIDDVNDSGRDRRERLTGAAGGQEEGEGEKHDEGIHISFLVS